MLCELLSQITSCCANLFQDFPFSLASISTLSFISKLNAGSILKVKVTSPNSDAISSVQFSSVVKLPRLFSEAPSYGRRFLS